MNQTLYIFRHGETFATKTGASYGDKILTAPILPEGIPSIKRMGKYLKDVETDYNVSSAIERCKQTSGIIAKITGKEFVFDKRLNEPYMESFADVTKRLDSLLIELAEKQYINILLCSHGAIIGTLLGFFTKQTFAQENMYNYPPPGVLTIVKENQVEQISFNQAEY